MSIKDLLCALLIPVFLSTLGVLIPGNFDAVSVFLLVCALLLLYVRLAFDHLGIVIDGSVLSHRVGMLIK